MTENTSNAIEIWKLVISGLTLLTVVVGGGWALYVWQTTRKGQAQVGFQSSVRLQRNSGPNESLLFLRLRIANTSSVLFRYTEGTATLMDASSRYAAVNQPAKVRLLPVDQADPLLPVYGRMSKDPTAIAQGELFDLASDEISLEPGEHVDTEVVFVLRTDRLNLMAVRVLIQGKQGRWSKEDYWWGTFFFANPAWIEDAEEVAAVPGK